jgi:hypothetical protein
MKDGMTLLDLGCGWGSVALYFAEKFKKSRSAFCYEENYFRCEFLIKVLLFVSIYTFISSPLLL